MRLFYGKPDNALLGLDDEFDFYQGALGEVLDGECAACRVGCGEVLGVNLVHGAEVGDVTEENGGLYHVLEIESLTLEDGTGVLEALVSLLLYASLGECAGLRDDGQLARYENEVAGTDGLAIRSDGGGCFVCV